MEEQYPPLIQHCEALCYDPDFDSVKKWKAKHPGGKAVGYMPIYVPREIIHAAGMLAVGIFGGGDKLEIIRGDAYFQSYICHIPRSTIELGVTGKLDCLDAMIFPSICDVIRNLSGMWKLLFPGKYVKYLDVPQNFDQGVGGEFYRHELRDLIRGLEELAGVQITADKLRSSIRVHNLNRQLCAKLLATRSRQPWNVPTTEAYLLLRAGTLVSVEEHNEMLKEYLEWIGSHPRPVFDNSRVVVRGAFCEQPPLGLIKTIERSGCYIVDDDFMLGLLWISKDLDENTADPLGALVAAFLCNSTSTASKYEPEHKGRSLVEACKKHGAEGVIFCAPSFCDPALLDQPMLQEALKKEGIQYTAFKYSEDTGQFGVIREQAGTFADSIKLWSAV